MQFAFLNCPVCISQMSNLYFSTVHLVFLKRPVAYISRVVVVTVSERVNEILGVLWLATMLRSRSPLCPPELSLSTPRPQLLTPQEPLASLGLAYKLRNRRWGGRGGSLQMITVLHRGDWLNNFCQNPM